MTANPDRFRIAWPRPALGDRVTQRTMLNEPRWVAWIGNPVARPRVMTAGRSSAPAGYAAVGGTRR
jgi:hypothetical protein